MSCVKKGLPRKQSAEVLEKLRIRNMKAATNRTKEKLSGMTTVELLDNLMLNDSERETEWGRKFLNARSAKGALICVCPACKSNFEFKDVRLGLIKLEKFPNGKYTGRVDRRTLKRNAEGKAELTVLCNSCYEKTPEFKESYTGFTQLLANLAMSSVEEYADELEYFKHCPPDVEVRPEDPHNGVNCKWLRGECGPLSRATAIPHENIKNAVCGICNTAEVVKVLDAQEHPKKYYNEKVKATQKRLKEEAKKLNDL